MLFASRVAIWTDPPSVSFDASVLLCSTTLGSSKEPTETIVILFIPRLCFSSPPSRSFHLEFDAIFQRAPSLNNQVSFLFPLPLPSQTHPLRTVMACRLFSDAINSDRSDLKRSNSSLSLLSPPSTKRRNTTRNVLDMGTDEPGSPTDRYSSVEPEDLLYRHTYRTPVRPRTSRARIPDRITEQQILQAREMRAMRDEAANPFLEKAGEIHEAKKLAPRTDGMTHYVLCVFSF